MGEKLRGPVPRFIRLGRSLYPGVTRVSLRGRPLAVLSIVYVLMIIATGWYLVVPCVLLHGLSPDKLDTAVSASTNATVSDVFASIVVVFSSPLVKLVILVLFNVFIMLCTVSYLLTALCDPGQVPDAWRPLEAVPAVVLTSPSSQATPPKSSAGSNPVMLDRTMASDTSSNTPATGSNAGVSSPLALTFVKPKVAAHHRHQTQSDMQRQPLLAVSEFDFQDQSFSSDKPVLKGSNDALPGSASPMHATTFSMIGNCFRSTRSVTGSQLSTRVTTHVSPPIPPPIVHLTAAFGPDGNPRFCRTCKIFKPARTHHCSVCRRCTLEMDHHCPFTGNTCIGFMNRKFFMLFLYYATISCTFVSILAPVGILRGIDEFGEDISGWGVLWLVGILFGYMLCLVHAIALAVFSVFHTFLVLRNSTTIEHSDSRGDDPLRFDRGKLRNWRAVFGSRPLLWFVPVGIAKEGDGVRWHNLDDIL